MGVDEIYPSTSDYLKESDLKKQAIKLVVEKAEVHEVGQEKEKKVVLSFTGKDKTLVLNKTNAKTIASEYGDDYSLWAGNEITVYPDKTNFGGEIVPCIRVRIDVPDAAPGEEPNF